MFQSLRQGSKRRRLSQQAGAPSSASASVAPSNRPLSPSESQASTNVHSQNTSRNIGEGQNYGIHVLYDGLEACVDVVFVHGLTGDAYDTWLHKESGIHWPSDLLRQDIPDIRVLSFGFDADVVHFFGNEPASNSGLTNHAESLVNKLVRERERNGTEERKIIFVAHSLGGLVTEQALTHSKNSAELHLKQVERDTIGVVFLGVPHCGSDLEAWATIGRRIVGVLKRTSKNILDVLNPDSEMLHLVENNFHTNIRQRRDNPIQITSFFEELAVTGIGEIVPQRSAKIPGYACIGIHANHQNMTKYRDRKDPGYDSVLGELQRWVKPVRSAKRIPLYTGLDVCKLSAEELACLQSFCPLGIDYQSQKDQNPRRVTGTCLWALHNPKYLDWRDKDVKRVIWISADPGCGKSVLARCIVDEDLPNASPIALPKRILYYFFKDTSPEQRSASRALCAMLHQLFTSCPRLIQHAMPKYKERGGALCTTLPQLWSIFMTATADPTAGSVICVLDALDECDDQEQSRFIEYLGNFCLRQGTSPSTSSLKFLVTSRPYFDIRREFGRVIEAVNDIELAGTDESTNIKKEIDLVIKHKVASLERENHIRQGVTEHLKKRLLEIEHRTYLWLHLLWKIIEKDLSGTKSGMDRLIDNLPDDIQGSYKVLLDRCPNRDFARKVLQIVLVAGRPLTLVEMDFALYIDDRTLSYAELEGEGPDRLRETLPSRCGLMISITDDKVYFIHHTVKEFLLKKDGTQRTTGRGWQQSMDFQESHRVLAEACLLNLSLPGIHIDQTNYLNALLPEDYYREMQPNAYCRRFTFLSYSAIYWADHFRHSLSNRERTEFVADLLQGNDQASSIGRYGKDYGFGLQAASIGGYEDIMQMLLDKGADVNAQGGFYGNALQAASAFGYQVIVQMLLEKGADVNAQGGQYTNALQAASSLGHQDIVQLLLDKGADINAQGGWDGNALYAASFGGHQDIVQLLLDKGADVNVQAGKYDSALQAASRNGYQVIVKTLLDKGADINAQGGRGGNALYAASFGGHQDIVQLLLDKGADVNAQGRWFGNALYAASFGGHQDIVQLLLDKGADVNVQAGKYDSALQAASRNGYQVIVKTLLEKGADINAQGGWYGNALQAASRYGYQVIIQLLLDKGADVNVQGGKYDSALQAASRNGYQVIVQMLLDKGARWRIK